ncbi:hypothetical protein GGI21_000302 [Coemansia aciculifera]|uniref:Uncharacterized protein n=1 Tax=Coemansia aciculifera TaxID=417176 RepID=A0ACC1M7U2_9FUNG|nr:hypothetical protein IWW38_001128 [Coemansia aciculifera]KAJ2911007.1 hypothetical protein GGI21_000302 [Coemansia aciculifera]
MDHFRKLKAKFENLTTHDSDSQKQSSGSHGTSTNPPAQPASQQPGGYPPAQPGAQQQGIYPPLKPGDTPQATYASWTMPTHSETSYPPTAADDIGPGGFFAPMPQNYHQQQYQQQYGGSGNTFPGGMYPGASFPGGGGSTYPGAAYPPQSYPTYPPPSPGGVGVGGSGPPPYPPVAPAQEPPSKPQVTTTNPFLTVNPTVGNAPGPSSGPPSGSPAVPDNSRGQESVPPQAQQDQPANLGVPLPLDQHDIMTTTENGQKRHVSQPSDGSNQMQFLNIASNEMVHQRFLIVYGQVPGIKGSKDRVVVRHPYFPPLTFPAVDGYFKILVELESGDNALRFEYLQGEAIVSQGDLTIKMEPYLDRPPLILAIVVGSDSKGIFDSPPDARGPGINDLDAAVRKFRCCAYLWQAFIAEHMHRQGFGRRTIRLEEEYEPDTMARDNERRMTAKVHVIRSKRTVAEIQDKERAQQWNPPPGYKRHTDESQFSLANEALDAYGAFTGSHHVACLSLDSHWDPEQKIILGHAALGGGSGDRRLGVFGSHTTHAWPANAEEVAAKFLDTTITDTRYLANDAGGCGEYWRSANVGMGAFLHECGHLLTLAHTPSGIMSRGFDDFNRTFMIQAPGFDGPVRQRDEGGAHWHRTDIVRLRHHPCLRLPGDPPLRDNEKQESGFDVLPTERGLLIQNDNGISMIEVWVNGEYRNHREYTTENLDQRRNGSLPAGQDEMATAFPREIVVDMDTWNGWAGGWSRSDKLQLVLTSRATSTDTLENVNELLQNGSSRDQDGNIVFKANQLGKGQMQGSKKFEAMFSSKDMRCSAPPKLASIEIRAGDMLDGFILHLEDGSERKVGKCKGGNKSVLYIDPDDDLDHIVVNSGWWIDGMEFVTRNGHTSGWKGGRGGGKHVVKPPLGYCWMGISGSGADWLDSLTMHYARRK